MSIFQSHPISRPTFIDHANERHGRLIVLGYLGRGQWLCRCDCGKHSIAQGGGLWTRQSCGCHNRQWRHGASYTNTYKIWAGMRRRCQSTKDKAYKNYGGRGIAVCEHWQEYAMFLADMGERPSRAHSLERIDNDGHYGPGNVRWATRNEQQRNQRRTRLLEHAGRVQPLVTWAEEARLDPNTLHSRLKLGWPLAIALEYPANNHAKLKTIVRAGARI